MKRAVTMLLALVLTAALAGCGGSDTAEDAPYHFLDETLGEESYAIGFRPGDGALAETVSGAVLALVLNGTYGRIGARYPEIASYLCLKAEDVVEAALPAEGSGDPAYTFRQGFDPTFAPYTYLTEDGDAAGFDVELCRAVCDYLGWQYAAVPLDWAEKDAALRDGVCDCVWSGFTKEGREDGYVWGITYSYNTQGILVARASGITALDGLRGKTVGVQSASSAAAMLETEQAALAATFAELRYYDSYTLAYEDLRAGAIDAVAIDMTVGGYLATGQ